MNIKGGLFEKLDKVEVAMNNDEVTMNNDNNEFRKMITDSANKENIILSKIKINMKFLSLMSVCQCRQYK